MRCSTHGVLNCIHSSCRRERERREATVDSSMDPTNPMSPPYQDTFATFTDTTSSSSCDTSSSSSYDSGSSGSASYDSGSSSDCGSY